MSTAENHEHEAGCSRPRSVEEEARENNLPFWQLMHTQQEGLEGDDDESYDPGVDEDATDETTDSGAGDDTTATGAGADTTTDGGDRTDGGSQKLKGRRGNGG